MELWTSFLIVAVLLAHPSRADGEATAALRLDPFANTRACNSNCRAGDTCDRKENVWGWFMSQGTHPRAGKAGKAKPQALA